MHMKRSGLSRYTELSYLCSVWEYHDLIVQALEKGEFDQGYRLMLDHMGLIKDRTPDSLALYKKHYKKGTKEYLCLVSRKK